jgi:tripartite-type tricarboxylate transporter receptor subunit TctC
MAGSRIRALLCAAVFAFGATGVARAEDFPSRPLRMVVGFGPGGLGDIAARSVAQKMSAALGKPVVIENMPGAGGMTAAANVARSAPDGHTLLLVSGQNAISPAMFKSMPYDWHADFASVSTIGVFDFIIVVAPNSPLKTVQDVIAAAKNNPTGFNVGTISVGSAQHLTALLFESMAGVTATNIPFRTTGDVVTGLLSGNIQVAFETIPGVMGQLQSGSLRAIAVSSDRRLPSMPDVPTVAESGLPGYNVLSWNGFVVPAKTPREIVARLNKEIAAALATPDVSQRFHGLGLDPRPSTPEAMQKLYDTDEARWRKVISDAKLAQQ